MLAHDGEGAIGVRGRVVGWDIVRGDAGDGGVTVGTQGVVAKSVTGDCGLAVAVGHVVHSGGVICCRRLVINNFDVDVA